MKHDENMRSLRRAACFSAGVSTALFAIILFALFFISISGVLSRVEESLFARQRDVLSDLFRIAQRDMHTVAANIAGDLSVISLVAAQDQGFAGKNRLNELLFESFDFNFLLVKDRMGNDLYNGFLPHAGNHSTPLPGWLSNRLGPFARDIIAGNVLLLPANADRTAPGIRGILMHEGMAYFAAGVPVARSPDFTENIGALFLGTLLDNAYFERLTRFQSCSFSILPPNFHRQDSALLRANGEYLETDLPLTDIDGAPLLLSMSMMRSLYSTEKRILNTTVFLLAAVMVLFALFLYSITTRRILAPVEAMSRDISRIDAIGGLPPDNYSKYLETHTLYKAVNSMFHRMRKSNLCLDLFQRIFWGTDILIYVSDLETDSILFINDNMKAHFGLDDSVIGGTCWKVFQTGFNERCASCPKRRLERDPDAFAVWEERNSITGKYYRNTDRIIEWTDGRPVHLQHRFEITDLKKSEICLKRRLEQQELAAAKELAESSSRAKSEFLSLMGHEISTPLNTIIGITGMARTSPELERKEYCLGKIEDASIHLMGVINDILDMSKIEANKFELNFTEFVFGEMLIRVVNVVYSRVEEKGQTLSVNLDPRIPFSLVSDEQRLAQVITNLLANAVKFAPECGLISLNAELAEETKEKCVIRVEVKDTGIGISPEQQSHLFNAFEQANGGIARRFGGTGLAVAKSIITTMDGNIWLESAGEKGAVFVFTVPCKRGGIAAAPLFDPSINPEHLRLLVVDESPEVLGFFKNFAETARVRCDTISSVDAAETLLGDPEREPYDIAFIGAKTQGTSFLELTRRIRAVGAFRDKDTAVVYVTSASEWALMENAAKTVGAETFMSKPLFASIVAAHINNLCVPEGKVPPKTPRIQ